MTKFYTLIGFSPEASCSIGYRYRGRTIRSYLALATARGQRTALGGRAKRLGQPTEVRILRTEIHEDGTVVTEWVE
ncbi:hypothetical protein [Mycobacterium sp. AZCC_0083]|uniref:hypothetical protein n=1 Tax=Mycobacterium sp. AZCC_0083 TaxID=2735882 RepID=UPI0016225116|nr:hypothetical protein [Mycobacterium sp. AZCC_0083]MBB5167217.1 hypothetical protein [Mycobacterium sp. AZCC_0083]